MSFLGPTKKGASETSSLKNSIGIPNLFDLQVWYLPEAVPFRLEMVQTSQFCFCKILYSFRRIYGEQALFLVVNLF